MKELLSVEPINIKIAKDYRIVQSKLVIKSGDVILLTGPNGCGKSTVIKILMGDVFDYSGLDYGGSSALFYKNGNEYRILEKQSDMDMFRNSVCYVSQDDEFESESLLDCFMSSIERYDIPNKEKYIFDFLIKHSAFESFYFRDDAIKLGFCARRVAKKIGLKISKLSLKEKKSLLLMTMNVKRMSGGQRKLSNILTNLIRYEYCSLLIMDEPLNNLDYKNVRAFSNILTSIYKDKPELGILMVTHCRSIPIINKVYEIDPVNKRVQSGAAYKCNSCFGEIDSEGYYI